MGSSQIWVTPNFAPATVACIWRNRGSTRRRTNIKGHPCGRPELAVQIISVGRECKTMSLCAICREEGE